LTLFQRRFNVDQATEVSPTWWNDLLSLWRPSGVSVGGLSGGGYGLRLAVRNGYLNFYRKGQSVARVGFDRKQQPFAKIHAKYVFPEERDAVGSEYLRLTGDTISRRSGHDSKYAGSEMLLSWIVEADGKAGPEKKAIDAILDLSPDIIDLEMGQPGSGLRMDIVCIERDATELAVAFWEAKRTCDSRVRCNGALDLEAKKPEVLEQLDGYRKFVKAEGNIERIKDAYKQTADILMRLRIIADKLGTVHGLGANIVAAASSDLSVRPEARLLIIHDCRTDGAWERVHAPKLEAAQIPMLVQAAPARLAFAGPC